VASRPFSARSPRSLRARLTLSIAGILVLALAIAFATTYRGTGTQVQHEIDQELRQDVANFSQQAIPRSATTPAEVERGARRYLLQQITFGEAARIFIVHVVGGTTLTRPAIAGLGEPAATLAHRLPVEPREAVVLRNLRSGYTTVRLDEGGPIRMLAAPLMRRGQLVAQLAVGESQNAVERAQNGVARTFAFAGSAVLLAAIVAGYLLATRLSEPLRQMGRTVSQVAAGDLSQRIASTGPRDEVRVLADAFNRMLDRLQDAFARQQGFAADASHELRTPLTVIRGQLEVLARQPEVSPEDVRRVEQVVRTEVVRMERLVEDLMLLARSDEDELLRIAPFELNDFVTELFDALTLTADRRFELGPVPSGMMRGDADRIAQVVRNLARNAVEHTAAAGLVRMTVAVRGGRVEIGIEDDGPGIPTSQRDRIFDRFHRTDNARARREGGTGLGLAIARAIVDAHGGRIFAGQSPEGGARVWFELPGFRPVLPGGNGRASSPRQWSAT
jgi:two-component system, OmpR family, sensor kinase